MQGDIFSCQQLTTKCSHVEYDVFEMIILRIHRPYDIIHFFYHLTRSTSDFFNKRNGLLLVIRQCFHPCDLAHDGYTLQCAAHIIMQIAADACPYSFQLLFPIPLIAVNEVYDGYSHQETQ